MRKQFYFIRLMVAVVVATVLAGTSAVRAQQADITSWLHLGAEYELKEKGLALESGLEWRTEDRFRRTDRVSLSADGAYEVLPWLEVGAGYEIHFRQKSHDWGIRHRYRLQAVLSTRLWERLKVSLRERFQHTLDGDDENELRLRSRVKLAYDLPRSEVEPYASVEAFNGLACGEQFRVTRLRYRGGAQFPLVGSWDGELFYIYQDDRGKKGRHVLGVKCVYRF